MRCAGVLHRRREAVAGRRCGREDPAPTDLVARLGWFEPHVHGVQPRMLSITQATERGAMYTPAEIRALADIAHERDMAVHMDGARFANALVAQNVSPAELTWKAGVDVLSFGVIKNGGMNAEAVVFFDPTRVADFEFRRKRAGQLLCKGRYAAVQLLAYIESGMWQRNAERANRLAARIAAAAPQLLSEPLATNQVFMKLGDERIAALSKDFGFYPWGPAGLGRGALRLFLGHARGRCRCAVRRAREVA